MRLFPHSHSPSYSLYTHTQTYLQAHELIPRSVFMKAKGVGLFRQEQVYKEGRKEGKWREGNLAQLENGFIPLFGSLSVMENLEG